MNANGLPRLYDRLTAWERIPLLIAADGRGDDAEARRLLDTSPIRTWHFAEHLLAEQALHVMAFSYIAEQLDLAATYFFAVWRMGDDDALRPIDWLLMVETSAYRFTVNLDAWRRFCSELDIAPDILTAANQPRGWILPYCEERMPANAPTAAALQDRFRGAGQDVPPPVTADSLLASWRDLLRSMTRCTPRVGERAGQ
jgi:hypothetical protein